MDHLSQEPMFGLSAEDFMITYHDGELASLAGLSLLACPCLDDPIRIKVWVLGYMETPIDELDKSPRQ